MSRASESSNQGSSFNGVPGMDPRTYDPSTDIGQQVAEAKAQTESVPGSLVEQSFDIKAGAIASAIRSGKRAFVSYSKVNATVLVRVGKTTLVYQGTRMPVVPGAVHPGGTEIRRVGDIRLQFAGGVAIIDPSTEEGQVQLAWAESHPEQCRDAMDPDSETWAALKRAQLNLADREPSLPGNINVDNVLKGDFSGLQEKDSVVARARRMLAQEAERDSAREPVGATT